MCYDSSEELPIVIIDNGTLVTKAGLCGEEAPKVSFHTVVGYPKTTAAEESEQCYVGEECMQRRDELHVHRPVQRGVVNDWDHMETLWRHVMENELRVVVEASDEEPDVSGVMLMDRINSSLADREKMCQIMFETFDTPGFHLAPFSSLALYAAAKTTGVAVHCGEGISQAVPVYEGFTMDHAVQNVNSPTGGDVTDYAASLLAEVGVHHGDTELWRRVKEECYCSMDFQGDMNSSGRGGLGYRNTCFASCKQQEACQLQRDERVLAVQMAKHPRLGGDSLLQRVPDWLFERFTEGIGRDMCSSNKSIRNEWPLKQHYQMPDSTVLTIHDQIVKIPELTFSPTTRENQVGIHQMISNSIAACDIDVRADLYRNIVLHGGQSMFANFPERIKTEIDAVRVSELMAHGHKGGYAFVDTNTKPHAGEMDKDSALLTLERQRQTRICALPERAIQEWLGGSILASLSTFPRQMILRGQNGNYNGYDDVGPRAVRTCYR